MAETVNEPDWIGKRVAAKHISNGTWFVIELLGWGDDPGTIKSKVIKANLSRDAAKAFADLNPLKPKFEVAN